MFPFVIFSVPFLSPLFQFNLLRQLAITQLSLISIRIFLITSLNSLSKPIRVSYRFSSINSCTFQTLRRNIAKNIVFFTTLPLSFLFNPIPLSPFTVPAFLPSSFSYSKLVFPNFLEGYIPFQSSRFHSHEYLVRSDSSFIRFISACNYSLYAASQLIPLNVLVNISKENSKNCTIEFLPCKMKYTVMLVHRKILFSANR